MEGAEEYINERLDHLGIVAGVCQEIGLASRLDAQEPGNRKPRECGNRNGSHDSQRVGVEPPAIVLNPAVLREQTAGTLGFDQKSLPRCERVDCLGRTLDWLYAHDLTKLFAGRARRARQIFGIKAEQVHVDTTSFSVSGQYE